jgi:hypothetical protein
MGVCGSQSDEREQMRANRTGRIWNRGFRGSNRMQVYIPDDESLETTESNVETSTRDQPLDHWEDGLATPRTVARWHSTVDAPVQSLRSPGDGKPRVLTESSG